MEPERIPDRARRYPHRQRPNLAVRLIPAADYRPLEAWSLKVPTAVHGLAAIARRRVGRAIVRSKPTRLDATG